MRKILFLIICSVFLISGCGSSGGGAEFFETVTIAAHSEITSLDSDIMVWKSSGDLDDSCDGYEIWPDAVEITIKSVAFTINDSEIPSPVEIENVRIYYEPYPNTPPLASQYWELGQIVEPDEEVNLEIIVMHTEQKSGFLKDLVYYTALIKNMAYFTYNVTLTFGVVEIDTDKKGEVTTGLTIKLHDYICKEGETSCEDDDDCYHDPNEFLP